MNSKINLLKALADHIAYVAHTIKVLKGLLEYARRLDERGKTEDADILKRYVAKRVREDKFNLSN